MMLSSPAALGGNQLLSSSFNFQEKYTTLFGFSIHRNFRHPSFSSSLTLMPLICRASIQVQKASHKRKDTETVHGMSETIVGVLGGGQLGRMLCQAASQMAIKVIVLDPMENCPASSLSHYHMVGSYDNSATVEEFSRRCGVLTVEIEHVDTTTLEKLEQQGVDCQPKASTIRIIQDKYLQKVHFSRHAIPLPEFMQINDLQSAERAGVLFGYPLMVKRRRLAYDGRGNAVAKSEQELTYAVNGLGGYDHGLYVEKWAPFVKVRIFQFGIGLEICALPSDFFKPTLCKQCFSSVKSSNTRHIFWKSMKNQKFLERQHVSETNSFDALFLH